VDKKTNRAMIKLLPKVGFNLPLTELMQIAMWNGVKVGIILGLIICGGARIYLWLC